MPETKRILELNYKHPLIEKLQAMAEKDAEKGDFAIYSQLLYEQALLAEGSPIADSREFAANLTEIMLKSIK